MSKKSGPVAVERIAGNLANAFRERPDEHVTALVVVRGPAPVTFLPKQLEALRLGTELRDPTIDGFTRARIAHAMHHGDDPALRSAGQQYAARPDAPPENATYEKRDEVEYDCGTLRFPRSRRTSHREMSIARAIAPGNSEHPPSKGSS